MKQKTLLFISALLFGAIYGFAQNNTIIWGIKASVDVELPSKWHYDGGSVTMFRPGYGFTYWRSQQHLFRKELLF